MFRKLLVDSDGAPSVGPHFLVENNQLSTIFDLAGLPQQFLQAEEAIIIAKLVEDLNGYEKRDDGRERRDGEVGHISILVLIEPQEDAAGKATLAATYR